MCQACYQRWWRKGNRAKARAYLRRYYRLHPEKVKETNRKSRERKPQLYKEINRRARKRWRKKNPDLWNLQKRKNYKRGAQHDRNSGYPYDDFDNQMILDKAIINNAGEVVRTGVSDRDLAQYLGRTVQAIQVQRHRLKHGRA